MATLPWQLQYDTPKNDATAGASPSPALPWTQVYEDLASKQNQPAESQRMRMMAQGASMGWSDEIEAALRSMFPGQQYEPVLRQIRGEISAYKQDEPEAALLQEIGGAGMTGVGGLKMLAGKSPTLMRLLTSVPGVGAVMGGTTAAGMSEGSALDRLAAVPAGAALGAVTGAAGYGVGKGIQIGFNKFMDVARRRLGKRGASIVEKELERIADESGMTVDEIVSRVASGEIMAENASIRDTVRFLTRGGGGPDAQKILRDALTRRPGKLRNEAIAELNQYLAPGMTGNVRKAVTQADKAAKAAEKQAYESAFATGGVIDQGMLQAIEEGIRRSPKAGAALQEAYRAQTGKTPFFRVEDGQVVYDRAPTLRDAEILRRGLRDLADTSYRSGAGSAAEGYKEAANMLRDALDASSPMLQQARTGAAQLRNARDAFEYGKKIFVQNADQVSIDFEKFAGDPNTLKYMRAGVMDAIRARMASGNKLTTTSKLADDTTKEGQILRQVFPGDQLDYVLGSLGRAARSQRAAGEILGGSPTAPTQMAGKRIGSGISLEEMASAARGNLFVLPNVAAKLINNIAPKGLSPSQQKRIAEVLVAENPQIVLDALKDQSGLMRLQQRVAQMTANIPGFGLGAGAGVGGIAGSSMMSGEQ
jgi:flagellar biosynthesis regulator FlaF